MGGEQPAAGDDGISWDKANKCFVGTVSLGFDAEGRRRRSVRGRTKAEVKDKLKELHEEINAGIYTPATYIVEACVSEWLDELTLGSKPSPSTGRPSAMVWYELTRRPTPVRSPCRPCAPENGML